uniref:Uncharacterized protein AlNc14C339G10769 n=1 Tax=Albugo laibachii Nc14 TaxID=890382 RepID=F0WX13_9STRA|nr:hypothetical protein MPER_13185 [Albugo laibachii Nc14]|eukprot:CCA26001.1 hypothetical protein MPER_13185 [Albugo laibachii Nc14]
MSQGVAEFSVTSWILQSIHLQFCADIASSSTFNQARYSMELGEDQQKAFHALKLALQQQPTLKLSDFTHPFIVTTDASGFCMGGVLSQRISSNDHAIEFYSKHLGPHELKCPAHEKELLAIKTALEKWRPYLHERHFSVYTDNLACKWMLHHPMVSPKMARMLTFFSQFDFVVHHVKGWSNVVADALSRPAASGEHSTDTDVSMYNVPDMLQVLHDCSDACNLHFNLLDKHMVHSALTQYIRLDVSQRLLDVVELRGESRPIGVAQEQIHKADFHVVRAHLSKEVRKAIQQGYSIDKFFKNIWKTKQSNNNFIIDKRLTFLKQDEAMQQIYIPDMPESKTKIVHDFHDAATAAHPGVRRTYMKLKQWYYWPKMLETVQKYVETCETCARWKSNSQRKNGLMIPIPIPGNAGK